VLNIAVCAERTVVFWTVYSVLNFTVCVKRHNFFPTDEICPEFCSFSLLFLRHLMLRLVDWQGRHSRSPHHSGMGRSPLLQIQGPAQVDVWQLRLCCNLSCVVLVWNVCYKWVYDLSCLPTQQKTLTWYARFKYICLYVLVMFRHVDWFAFYLMDNIRVLGKHITTFSVRVLAEAQYRQSTM